MLNSPLVMSKFLNFEFYLVETIPLLSSILDSIGETDDNAIWKSLMQIFIIHKKDPTLISQCTAKELEFTEKEDLLLRGGGVYIRILSEYVNIFGKYYVREVLGPSIRKIAKGVALEVDPSRLKSEAQIEVNRHKLCKACQRLFDLISSSTQQIPLRVRQVLWELNDRIGKAFPNSFNRIIGAFFFLRYICPAIVHPENYGIISDCSVESRRKLTLVTKLLQNIANETIGEEKETYMTFFSEFVKTNLKRLPSLCEKLLDTSVAEKDYVPELKRAKNFDHVANILYTFVKEKFDVISAKLEVISPDTAQNTIKSLNKIFSQIDENTSNEPEFNFPRRRSTTPVRSEMKSPPINTLRPRGVVSPSGQKSSRRSSVDSALGSRVGHRRQANPRLHSSEVAPADLTYESSSPPVDQELPSTVIEPKPTSENNHSLNRRSVPTIGVPLMNFVRNRLSTSKELKRYSSQSQMGALYEDVEDGDTQQDEHSIDEKEQDSEQTEQTDVSEVEIFLLDGPVQEAFLTFNKENQHLHTQNETLPDSQEDQSTRCDTTNNSQEETDCKEPTDDKKEDGSSSFSSSPAKNSKSAPNSPSVALQFSMRNRSSIIPELPKLPSVIKYPPLILTARSESPVRELIVLPSFPKTLSCDSLNVSNLRSSKEKKKKNSSHSSSSSSSKKKSKSKKKEKRKEKERERVLEKQLEESHLDGSITHRRSYRKTIIFSTTSQSTLELAKSTT
eukprot:TRINITY_DN68_c7_g1_i1.p1 TRINITY_DN68_c7_g1~~TRINITY_DN68_c7_g1_i1.p1  ORF type:complete len:731 (-),score=172.08 TRINITY_DN68_c7_g1_i1:208-2400(-)